nr:MAG TPA: hypothetical protein [Caudoviricetes sp.]
MVVSLSSFKSESQSPIILKSPSHQSPISAITSVIGSIILSMLL